MSWNSTETIRSHSENSDNYIDVESCKNRSHRLSPISDIYESVGSASYANILPGKYIQQATKRRYYCIYKVLFAFLCAFLLLTTLIALRLQLSGSDDSAATQIKSSCIPCNMSEVKGENDKTCLGRNFTESLIESVGAEKTAHFVSYVDDKYIALQFKYEFEMDMIRQPSKMHIYLPEWQGTLYRNSTFITEDQCSQVMM
ncbi:uncharacterized protein LOC128558691 isoform X2 [Mercenaria mercenaria]|uniref:uncharacterized protein LOC128558691 isoform X2 n=1 Tax=Mercenaria mercenaria TaxID=6596 RepID=UPI00234EEE4D|nr:uncharacterized protein LOC128558691 isoform X2 [Mercenaria mercenaria]